MTELSSRAQLVIKVIGEKVARKIKKDYPLRVDRNKNIRKVRRRGVEYRILAEISGLSLYHLKRICKRPTTRAQEKP